MTDGDLTDDQVKAIFDEIGERGEAEGYENAPFHLFHERTDRYPNRDLLVLVHPGDAVERGLDDAYDLMEEMGDEMISLIRDGSPDVVVVHRSSSDLVRETGRDVPFSFREAVRMATAGGSVLYSDDLDAAGEWIVARYEVGSRPKVLMTGAYSHRDFGCVTHVGRILEAAGATVVLSAHSPSDAGDTSEQWVPGTPAPGP